MRSENITTSILLICALQCAVYVGSGCKSGSVRDAITKGTEIADQIEAGKDAEKAEKEAARIAAEKAEADRIAAAAAEKAERERPEREAAKSYNPPSIDNYRKAALWKCAREGGGPGVALIHASMYGHVTDAYISRQLLRRVDATAAGAMVQSSLDIRQPEIFPISERGNGGKVHIRAKQANLTGPGYLIVVDRDGKHWWISLPDLGKRWGATHPSDQSPYGGPIVSANVGILE
jgi:hypothetical protein